MDVTRIALTYLPANLLDDRAPTAVELDLFEALARVRLGRAYPGARVEFCRLSGTGSGARTVVWRGDDQVEADVEAVEELMDDVWEGWLNDIA